MSESNLEELLHKYPELSHFEFQGKYKVAAAWMIDQLGWKQKAVEGVSVHQQQALVIVNPNKCSGLSVIALASEIQSDVKRVFGIDLEIEPRVFS